MTLGFEKAEISVDESINGMVKVVSSTIDFGVML